MKKILTKQLNHDAFDINQKTPSLGRELTEKEIGLVGGGWYYQMDSLFQHSLEWLSGSSFLSNLDGSSTTSPLQTIISGDLGCVAGAAEFYSGD